MKTDQAAPDSILGTRMIAMARAAAALHMARLAQGSLEPPVDPFLPRPAPAKRSVLSRRRLFGSVRPFGGEGRA